MNQNLFEFCFSSYFCLVKYWQPKFVAQEKTPEFDPKSRGKEMEKFYEWTKNNFGRINWFSFDHMETKPGKFFEFDFFKTMHVVLITRPISLFCEF